MVRYIASLGVSKHVNSDVEIVTDLTFTKQQMFDFAEFYANNSDAILNDELLKQFLNP